MLFADLVGFTPLSESRDAEEVRELLSRYFDICRRLIELYGGTVEKFIGDAVMAVWGTPTTTEDDAERAVRAALDLVAAVSALGQELGAEELRARAGVLTGEAAVTLGAVGEGMVAGDLVNTASRVQSVAEPGRVFVGESTRRATEHSVVYEEAGTFELKGKEGLTPLWRAVRVVSGVRGTLKSQGLEAPFVGRDRELRQIKELFHTCAEEKKAQLVSVTGIAGIGKSRLSWEFYKYFDGLAQLVYWHRGRCLAYGEGVTYWALADMVRMRCRIAEDEQPASAALKLRATVEEHLLDAEERRFVEPRLAHLIGLGEHESHDRQDLFAAWRLFFERLADVYPTVLAFEDMQWADASLLDFVEYLLEWSRNHPLYVVTLARPELLERRPTWGAGHRNFTSMYLEPLSQPAMEELLTGLVPGLPASLCERILTRAEGIPLYAVETVRMLLDRGALVQEGAVYRPVGTIESLEVPETLHALIAARLDGLSAEERLLLQDGAVLGKTFTRAALLALADFQEPELDALLHSLVRKEVLSLQSDPRSPEHGQYGFLQDLVRRVAYETLSRRDRRARHLAAAEHLSAALTDEEVTEVVASHLVDAYELDPDADDAPAIRERARLALVHAGERAGALAAAAEAQRYFERAASLTEEPLERRRARVQRRPDGSARRPHRRRAGTPRARAVRLRRRGSDAPGGGRLCAAGRGRLAGSPALGGGRAARGGARTTRGHRARRRLCHRRGGARSLPRPRRTLRTGRSLSRGGTRAGRGARSRRGVRPDADEQVDSVHAPQPPRGGACPARGVARLRHSPTTSRRRHPARSTTWPSSSSPATATSTRSRPRVAASSLRAGSAIVWERETSSPARSVLPCSSAAGTTRSRGQPRRTASTWTSTTSRTSCCRSARCIAGEESWTRPGRISSNTTRLATPTISRRGRGTCSPGQGCSGPKASLSRRSGTRKR